MKKLKPGGEKQKSSKSEKNWFCEIFFFKANSKQLQFYFDVEKHS